MRCATQVLLLCGALTSLHAHAFPARVDPAQIAMGELIYMSGIGPGRVPIQGVQPGVDVTLRGTDAACVNCHQRSGLGTHEGSAWIPPVAGRHLFRARVRGPHEQEVVALGGPRGRRGPYTQSTLALSIRSGLDADGRAFSDLMPRYSLDDEAMVALIAYLTQLGSHEPPGLTGGRLHFATVVTPDSDPVKRRGVLDVLQNFVAERNATPTRSGPLLGTTATQNPNGAPGLTNRHWDFQVWNLKGPPDTWGAQLERNFTAEPVFALLSGVGAGEWGPVDAFCERHGVPCLFPSAEAPVPSDQDFYSVYFSRGVLLEAQLIAGSIAEGQATPEALSVHQIFRAGDSGVAAAKALARELAVRHIRATSEAVPAAAPTGEVRQAVARSSGVSAVVLWLRPKDVAALANISPPKSRVYLSGLMSGGEHAPLQPAWRAQTRLSYPFELPQRRGAQLSYALGWFKFRRIPIVDMQAQSDAFLACTLLTDTLKLMAGEISAPFMIEQLRPLLEQRTLTGYYPRLGLAKGQHFASKGGYIVHFAGPEGSSLIPDSSWIVP